MKKFTILFLFIFSVGYVFSQSVSSTYNLGDIPVNYSSYGETCNGAATPLVVTLPEGDWLVTSVDVEYDITAGGGGWMSEQRSLLACQETGLDEGAYISGTGGSSGTMSYSRTADIANGTHSGDLTFELRVFRTYGSSPTCGTEYQKVDDGTWMVTVNYQEVPSCAAPAILTSNDITNSSANLGWTESGSATAWDIELGPAGFSPTGTPTMTGVTNPYVYGGLDAATTYDWYVRADCGEGDYSAWAGPNTFTTQCDAITVPYTENFDGDWSGDPAAPLCWSVVNVDGGNTWSQDDAYLSPHSDPWVAHGMGNGDDYLISPSIDLTGTNAQMSWWDIVESSNYANEYKVLVSTTNADIASFTDELADITCVNTDWEQHSVDLSAYADQTIFVAFYQYFSAASYYGFGIDDFALELAPECGPPTDLTATNITLSSADLGWTETGNATAWNVEVGESGFTPTEIPTHPGVDNPVTVEGLASGTVYDFYVQADCSTKATSTWVGPFTFVTLCEVAELPYSEGFESQFFPPVCWEGQDWSQSTYGDPHTGDEFAYSNTSGSLLTSPEFAIPAGDPYQLSFWVRCESVSYPQDMDVLISTDGINFDLLYSVEDLATITYQQIMLSLEAYAGESVWFRFEGLYGTGGYSYGICLDDMSVELIPYGTISGVVVAQETGDPVEGALVECAPEAIQTTTDNTGLYEFYLPVGEYELTFSHPDYNTAVESGVMVNEGDVTILDVSLMTLEIPLCSQLVGPADNSNNNLPGETVLEWAPDPESSTVEGYKILLYNVTDDIWLENETDLGNVTTYAPVDGFEWGKQYVWMILPYNNAGEIESCTPWYFNTSYSGMLQGVVSNAQTGLPVQGVDVTIEQVFPNPGNVFNLVTDENGAYSLEWESAVYNVTFSKYAYQTAVFNNESIYTNQVTQLDVELVPEPAYPLPFYEDWSSGNYDTQSWSYEGNWYMDINGNPGPSAIFYWNPQSLNYEHHLQSFFIDTRDEEQVFLQFDLQLSDYYYNGTENMTIRVFDGSEWSVLENFTNYGSFDYTTFTYDISDVASGNIILLDFMATGNDTYGFDWWHVDNILVTNELFDVDKHEVSEVVFFDETKEVDIQLFNYGAGTLEWEAELSAKADWLLLEPTSGTIYPGTETLTLTFDGSQAAKEDFTQQILLTINEGLIQVTIDVEMKHYEENGQEVMIPGADEWGYISSYINMDNKMNLEDAMADVEEEMIIMVGTQGIYWPVHEINTIGDFDNYEGYKIKMNAVSSLAFFGEMVEDQTVTFPAGTFIIPILSQEPVDVMDMLGDKDVEFAFGIDGTIYWPEGPIYTLETFYPGYGYLVKFNSETTLDFGVALPKDLKPNSPPAFENITPWNDVYRTGDFHMVGISSQAASELEAGDIIGVFNTEGQCSGMMNYSGQGQAIGIPVFADDVTTEATDGMMEYEPLIMKVFRDGREIMLTPVYSTDMPNSDGLFAVNGVSMILSFKEGATAIGEDPVQEVVVYPNPSNGVFNIDGINSAIRMQVTNAHGQVVAIDEINDHYTLDISGQPTGVYFIRLYSEAGIKIVKVVKQ